MKVSIIVSDISSAGAGRWGGAVRSFLLAKAFQKLNIQAEVFGFLFGEESTELSKLEIPIYSFNGDYYPKFLTSAFQALKKIDGDIIYAMRPKATTFGLSLLHRLKNHRPLILDIDDWELSWHGAEKWSYKPSLKQLARDIIKSNGALRFPDHPVYINWMEKNVNRADLITVHTRFLQDKFGGIYIPNGKDIEIFNPHLYQPEISRKRYGLSEYRVLMFPGAPRPYKGVEDVLKALDILNEPDIRLVIVGGSPYDDYDNQLMQQWGKWIIKLPKYPPHLMPEIVAAAHVVVVPQRNIPAALAQFPLKLTDGMAMAKPILATKVGDIPEILGETGYLVEPESPQQIAESIKYIFANLNEANQRGLQSRQRCIKHYSIDAMSEVLADVISKVSSSKSA